MLAAGCDIGHGCWTFVLIVPRKILALLSPLPISLSVKRFRQLRRRVQKPLRLVWGDPSELLVLPPNAERGPGLRPMKPHRLSASNSDTLFITSTATLNSPPFNVKACSNFNAFECAVSQASLATVILGFEFGPPTGLRDCCRCGLWNSLCRTWPLMRRTGPAPIHV